MAWTSTLFNMWAVKAYLTASCECMEGSALYISVWAWVRVVPVGITPADASCRHWSPFIRFVRSIKPRFLWDSQLEVWINWNQCWSGAFLLFSFSSPFSYSSRSALRVFSLLFSFGRFLILFASLSTFQHFFSTRFEPTTLRCNFASPFYFTIFFLL